MAGEPKNQIEFQGIRYEWLGQSTMRMTSSDGYVIYTDPVFLDENPIKANLILVTHHHVDHCLPEFITPIRNSNTKIVAYHESYLKYCVQDIKGVRTVKIGQMIEFDDIKITGVDAYTQRGFHRKGEGCGFLIEVKGQRIYFSGDTTGIDEMKGLKGIETAILPVCDNAYAIMPDAIINAVRTIQPKLFIPVHFTPHDEPDPQVRDGMLFSKDPRFYTMKYDSKKLLPHFEGSGIEVGLLKKLVKSR